MKEVLYERLKPREFIEEIEKCPIAYLPLGTLEWHGVHMPLGADGLQSQSFFELLAQKVGGVVLPKLFLGPDGEAIENGIEYHGMERRSYEEGHFDHLIGSVYYMPEKQFQDMLDRIVHNLSEMHIKIVVAHGHGPSVKAFAKMKQHFKETYQVDTYDCWELGLDGMEGFMNDHAAANETSITMGLHPELVDMDLLRKEPMMLGMRGKDPFVYSSHENGMDIVNKNLDKISSFLIEQVSQIQKDSFDINYNHALHLIEKGE